MTNWELIQRQLQIKNKILSNLYNEMHGLNLKDFNNTTGTESVKK